MELSYTATLASGDGDSTTRTAADLADALGLAIHDHCWRKSKFIADLIVSGTIEFDDTPPMSNELLEPLENAARAIIHAWTEHDKRLSTQ